MLIYTYRSCRCSLFQGGQIEENLRRKVRKRHRITQVTGGDWARILFYFSHGGREVRYLKVRGAPRRVPTTVEGVEDVRPCGDREEQMVGACSNSYQHHVREALQDGQVNRRGKRASSTLYRSQQSTGGQTLQEKIERILITSPVCPMVGIVNSDAWLNDPDLMYIRKDNKIVQNVIDTWQQKTCRWNLFDFNTFYSNSSCTPLFWAGYREFSSVYYDVEESIDKVEQLLKFQLNDDPNVIRQFWQDCYDVVERTIPKLGTLCLKGPPNGGKNWLMEIFLDYYWNRGQLGNLTRHNQFGLQEAVGKRLLLWDEPNYEPGMIETLKNVTAGHPYTVRVKQQADCAVYSTPLIMLTNNDLSMFHNTAFDTRIRKYMWKSAGFMKEWSRKPNPLCVYPLMLKWGIILPNPYNFVSVDIDDDLFDQ